MPSRIAWLLCAAVTVASLPAQTTPGALSGRRVVISAGHGYFWHSTLGWTTQRGVIDGTVEDLHTNQIVIDHLLNYLEGAGAQVITCRGRSYTTEEHVLDNDTAGASYAESGSWTFGAATGYQGLTYRYAFAAPVETARATYTFTTSTTAEFPVYLNYVSGTNRATQARVIVTHAGGTSVRFVDQTKDGARWRYLGTFPSVAGGTIQVAISNASTPLGSVVVTDAVRIGEGVGSIVRGGTVSGQPRWAECSRYWAEFNGAPSTVWNCCSGEDNTDDVSCRPRIATWWGADLFFSLHTNAGGGSGTDTFIHNTAAPPGSSTYQNILHQRVINDIRANWDPNWVDRGQNTANFGEVNGAYLSIPALLLELAFHDTVGSTDLESLHNPRFRQIAARAIYRGIQEYLAPGTPFVLDPPTALCMRNAGGGNLQLRWLPVAGATGYRIRTSTDGFAYDDGITIAGGNTAVYTIAGLPFDAVRYAKIAVINAGGTGPDSEPVGARLAPGDKAALLLVNGFDRNDRFVPLSANKHDAIVRTGAAVQGVVLAHYAFDGSTNEALAAGLLTLSSYRCVGWILGEESSADETFSINEQNLVSVYLVLGGRLFFSGAEVGWDLDWLGSVADRTFYEQTLGQNYVADDANTYSVAATAAGPLAPLPAITFDNGTNGIYDVNFPDVIGPAPGSASTVVMNYSTGGGAAVLRGDGRVLGLGFPIDAIVNPDNRRVLMERILKLMCPLPIRLAGTPTPGQALTIALDFPTVPSANYIAALSLGVNPGLPLGDGRTVPLNPDGLFFLSLDPMQPYWTGIQGTLSLTGQGQMQVFLPPVPSAEFWVSALAINGFGQVVMDSATAVRIAWP